MIVVFGSINLDLIFPLPALPAPGETVLTPSVRIEPGGKGANQALAARRDGAAVAMVGAVGSDGFAPEALRLLAEAGVDLTHVARTDRPTGCAGIFVDAEGRNAIAVGSGANLLASAAQVPDRLLGPETTLVLQMEVAAQENAALIRRARTAGSRIVLNLAPAAPIDADALRATDIVVVNEVESLWLSRHLGCDEGAGALRRCLGRPDVIRTLGSRGAEAATAAGLLTVPGLAVDVVDTTAAGDCFTGVLAAALDRGAPLPDALTAANHAAALCCTRAGSQSSMPVRNVIPAKAGTHAADGNPGRRGSPLSRG